MFEGEEEQAPEEFVPPPIMPRVARQVQPQKQEAPKPAARKVAVFNPGSLPQAQQPV